MAAFGPAHCPEVARDGTVADLAGRAGWEVRGNLARGACPLCGSSTGAWATVSAEGRPRVGCWACDDWRGLRARFGLDGAWAMGRWRPPPAPRGKTQALDMVTDAEALAAIYDVFARHLPMTAGQRRIVLERDRGIGPELHQRMAPLLGGLPTDDEARARVRRQIAEALREVAPPEILRRVPELAARRGGGHTVLARRDRAVYFEPWRDDEGRTVALRAYMGRRAERRYLASPGRTRPLLHVAFGVERDRIGTAPWILTEGWMKAEVAAHALGVVAVAFPGVTATGSWRRAIEIKQALAADAPLYVAFDAEAWTSRPDIAVHCLDLALEVQRATGREAGFVAWAAGVDTEGAARPKGIDDAIVAGARVHLVDRAGFARYLGAALDQWEGDHAAPVT